MLLLLILGLAWFVALGLIWLFIAGGTRPLSRAETERLREAAQAALRQSERRNVLVVLKPMDDVPSRLESLN